MALTYEKKIEFALKLLRSIPQDCEVELAYSGGKDSDVILELAKMSGIKFRAIYKNTTIDPPGTIAHAKEMGVEIVRPKETFFELIRKNGTPSRFIRHCCSSLKEYKICDRSIIGIRKSESSARAKRYDEPEKCRVYSKTEKVKQYYPILEWTNEDVERFIKERGITCAPVYYDRGGVFHVKRRLGCLCCPLMNYSKRIEKFKQYPKMLFLYIKNMQYWLDNHPNTKKYAYCNGSAHESMFFELFSDFGSKKMDLDGGLFGDEFKIDPKQFLEDYFGIDLTI